MKYNMWLPMDEEAKRHLEVFLVYVVVAVFYYCSTHHLIVVLLYLVAELGTIKGIESDSD